jgi:ATP adenylyltransferase
MDDIFAPWRIEWVEREDHPGDGSGDGCVFCELPASDEREALIVARSDEAYVLLNSYPYNPGHVMVIPFNHEDDYAQLDGDVLTGHGRLKQRTFDALRTAFDPDGFNAGLNLGRSAGGSITDHLHTHIVPRWEGDTNFMPVIGDTKVIVEALADTYDRLHEAFAAQDGATTTDGAVVVE